MVQVLSRGLLGNEHPQSVGGNGRTLRRDRVQPHVNRDSDNMCERR